MMRHSASTRTEGPRPMTLAVYIARRSGNRPRRQLPHSRTPKDVRAFERRVWQLLSVEPSSEPVRLGQYALRRCFYLYNELAMAERKQLESAILLGRCIIETALTGSYLVIRSPDAIAQFSKKNSGAAQMLRERFQQGDPLGALRLLGQVDFISESLNTSRPGVDQFPRFRKICTELDKHPPYATHRLASLIYEESYVVYSNHSEHPTIESLARHEGRHKWASLFAQISSPSKPLRRVRGSLFRPPRLVPGSTLNFSVAPAIGALCGTLARSLNVPFDDFDYWANEAAEVDGLTWSGSPARWLATNGLARLCELSTARRLDCAGWAVRACAAMGFFDGCTEKLQLLVCSQIFDDVREVGKLAEHFPGYGIISSTMLKKRRSVGRVTQNINNGQATTHPQSLLAALTLVYTNVWPDDSDHVSQALARIDAAGPIESNAILDAFENGTHRTSVSFREYRRSVWSRLKNQIETMP